MAKFSQKVLREEVVELTTMLRGGKDFLGLQRALEKKKLSPDDVVLVGFMEDEFGHEFGAIITNDLQVFEYRRNTGTHDDVDFVKWHKVKDTKAFAEKMYPTVEVGLELVRSKGIEMSNATAPPKKKRSQ